MLERWGIRVLLVINRLLSEGVGAGVRVKRALLQWLLHSVATVGAAPVDDAVTPVAAVAVAAAHPME